MLNTQQVTSNMVWPSTTPSKFKEKQLDVDSKESDVERSSGLKNILIEPKGLYRHTQFCTGMITLVDYNLLARGIKVNDEHSAIIESQSSNSYTGTEAFMYMANTPEEVAKKFKEQAQV